MGFNPEHSIEGSLSYSMLGEGRLFYFRGTQKSEQRLRYFLQVQQEK